MRLKGVQTNRDGIGANIRIGKQLYTKTTTVGYASSADTDVHIGVGAITLIPAVEIHWPSGIIQTLTNVKADQVLTVREER